MFDGVEIMVDLQTGAISMVLPLGDSGDSVELETVTADDSFAPQE